MKNVFQQSPKCLSWGILISGHRLQLEAFFFCTSHADLKDKYVCQSTEPTACSNSYILGSRIKGIITSVKEVMSSSALVFQFVC